MRPWPNIVGHDDGLDAAIPGSRGHRQRRCDVGPRDGQVDVDARRSARSVEVAQARCGERGRRRRRHAVDRLVQGCSRSALVCAKRIIGTTTGAGSARTGDGAGPAARTIAAQSTACQEVAAEASSTAPAQKQTAGAVVIVTGSRGRSRSRGRRSCRGQRGSASRRRSCAPRASRSSRRSPARTSCRGRSRRGIRSRQASAEEGATSDRTTPDQAGARCAAV